ncbi:MAG: DUF86 domain-containing protein [Clostridia bacterium]|nr:DUF86 domain-containing protein [Clostridia bacterium]
MDNRKDDHYYLRRIVTDLGFIMAHTGGITEEQLKADEVLLDSVMFRLIQVSENSDKLTDAFKTSHAEIPWRAMKGLRNRIVHEYGSVDLTVVYDTVKVDIPELFDLIAKT